METDVPTTGRNEWRLHWRAVAGSGICVATGYSVFAFVASQFVQPLQTSLGWSRSSQSLGQNVAFATAFLAPFLGRAVDRFGARRIGLSCMFALGFAYVSLASMRGQIAIYYILTGITVFIGLGTTGIVFMRTVSARFQVSLGLALAVTRSGVAISAAVLPVLVHHTIVRFGWRSGYAMLAGVVFLIGIPACMAWIPRENSSSSAQLSHGPWGRLLSNRRIVTLCLAVGFTMGPVVGILSQLQPLLTGKGIVSGTAAALGSVLAISVLAGTVVTGWLMDRLWAPLIGCAFLLASGIGCALLVPQTISLSRAALGVVFIGLTQGAELDLAGYLIARYFGIADYAAIFGLSILAIGLASASCQIAFAFLYDRTGGYAMPLQLSMIAFAAAFALFLSLGRYPARTLVSGREIT